MWLLNNENARAAPYHDACLRKYIYSLLSTAESFFTLMRYGDVALNVNFYKRSDSPPSCLTNKGRKE